MLGCLSQGSIPYLPRATYESFEGDTVLMGNDDACQIVEIGSIHMKIFDGRIRTLKDVRHIPDLRKNLFLLGALEAQGYTFSGTNGVLKVNKCSMMVLKGERTMNLYKVIKSVVIGDASIAKKKEDTTRVLDT